MERFTTTLPHLLSTTLDAQRNLTAVTAAMRPDDSAQAIASMIASAVVASAKLARWASETNDGVHLFSAACNAFDRLRDAAINDQHTGLFDVVAMPRFDVWPPAAKPYTFIDGESVFVLHDEHGDIFGHPELRDAHTYLWYFDPRMAAAHLSVLHTVRPEK